MNGRKAVENIEGNAIGAVAEKINDDRLDDLIHCIKEQTVNLHKAINELNVADEKIAEIIDKNRGGKTGMHGFIAEISEKCARNAEKLIKGKAGNATWINNNGPWDLVIDGNNVQVKFCRSGGTFSLNKVIEHAKKYAEIVDGKSRYMIPKDFYENIKYILSLSEKEANIKLNANTEPTLKQWTKIRELFKDNDMSIDNICPSKFKYSEVQVDVAHDTIKVQKKEIRKEDKEIKTEIKDEHKANFTEGAKLAAIGAALEGTTTLAFEIAKLIKSGKKINEFTNEDWMNVFKNSGFSSVKGAVRGITVYVINNYGKSIIGDKIVTNISGPLASGVVTASFGIVEQLYLNNKGAIDTEHMIENMTLLSLETSITTVCSCLGQTLIPVPVLGTIIGSTIGNLIYQAGTLVATQNETKLFEKFVERQNKLNEELTFKYGSFINEINEYTRSYFKLVTLAFSGDVKAAFEGSIKLAQFLNIPVNEILDSIEKTDDYFMN